mmetsp:Transcript_13149/g.19852  ORF Transcript_13149/g.19852 Transcript_13149/m.19852 type:complete len:123 (-) Transcript_13149:73-441(-)|eukprot:CAMPEP_0201553090 /NCGR_PEP_ID=MMETSP0173_2-20130828/19433_1 /ASSEMBLY_ACC=CAM_ASM_000268 /TAXON_ID=218659 /ORGANISM="Vexillifera sp., Strain DIVA3 564/2" /LENGTH=122 /DNA_ID=CAMNT_0047963701 /DNA_START=182 /DNA_END=550 /DNA_ORIENTATION=-
MPKATQLRQDSRQELLQKLEDLKNELQSLKVDKVTGGAPAKLSKLKEVRRSIARVNTVISQKQRDQLRTFYKKKKYAPLDLRQKKTRAIRRRLNPYERRQKTLRQKKRLRAFPQRKYAIRAD